MSLLMHKVSGNLKVFLKQKKKFKGLCICQEANHTCFSVKYNNTLFTHTTSRSDKNSLKHVRETEKKVKKNRNNLKLPSLIYPKTCFFIRHLKVEISLAFLTYVGNKFQSFAAKNENDLWHHSRLKLGNVKSVPDSLKL